MAFCLALKASAKPPARLGVGVLRPLSVPLPALPFILKPESRGAGGGAGFRPPAAGRLAGGAGGAGFARAADPLAPFAPFTLGGAVGGGGGPGLITGAGGASSLRYAEGAQPWPVAVFASHHPDIHVLALM
jgi:hypothetical protein